MKYYTLIIGPHRKVFFTSDGKADKEIVFNLPKDTKVIQITAIKTEVYGEFKMDYENYDPFPQDIIVVIRYLNGYISLNKNGCFHRYKIEESKSTDTFILHLVNDNHYAL